MTTKVISGLAQWAKLRENNRDFYDDKDTHGSYCLDLIISEPDAKAWEKSKVKVHRDKETGKPFLRLKRPHAIDWKDKDTNEDKTWVLGPPTVVDQNLTPFDGLIGNGSPVNVEVEEREYGGKAKKLSLRLSTVQVDTRTMVVFDGSGTKITKLEDPLNATSEDSPL